MKIGALLKIVPDTYAVPRISDDKKEVNWDPDTEFVRDRYSEFAVEEAVKTKESLGSGEVISFTITKVDEKKPIRKALATGVDKAVVIQNEGLFHSDPVSVARALAEEIKSEDIDLLFAGKFSSDQNNQMVGQLVAAILDIPIIAEVTELEVSESGIIASRKVGGRKETFKAEYPVMITAEKGLNEPRYPKLPDLMKAKRKPTDWKDAPQTEIRNNAEEAMVELPPEKDTEVVMIEEETIEATVEKLIQYLSEEEKVI